MKHSMLTVSQYAKSECQELVQYGSVAERVRKVKRGEEWHAAHTFGPDIKYSDRNITHDTLPAIHKDRVYDPSKEK